jgi:hypothetical protein
LVGMEINSAVEFGGRCIILHSDHSLWVPRGTRLIECSNRGECVEALPARRPDDNKKPTGLNWEYQIAAGNSRCATSFVSHWFHKVICSGASRLPAAVPELGR